jgi:hypothetical protein
VEISKKAIIEQMKKSGTKVPYSKIKEALKTSIKVAGKTANDQPTKGKGKVEYPGGKIDFTSEK